jgi:membrane fusion protein, multidrug efflux system
MRHRRAFLGILTAAAVAGAAGLFMFGRGTGAAATTPAAPPTVPVVAGTVESGNVPIYLRGIGTVEAYNTVVVRSQIQGQLIRIDFSEGQIVHKGDLLAQIDPRPYHAQLDQATANRDRDSALLANAQANLARDMPLLEEGFATPQAVDQDKANVGQYTGAVKADEAAIETAQVQLGYTRLTSPVDGVTGIRQIDIGNIIYPNATNGLVTVTQMRPISLIFTLPETELPRIQRQMTKGPLTVLAFGQDNKSELGRGELLLVNNEINQATGTLQLKAVFANPGRRLWPGQLVNARLLLETRPHGLTVPAPAVQQGPSGAFFYVIKPDGTVVNRLVAVGQIGNKRAVINAGLKAGERVVVNGQSRLQPGSRVTVVTGQAAHQIADQTGSGVEIP